MLLTSTASIDPDDVRHLAHLAEALLWRARIEREFPTPVEKIVGAAGARQLLDVDKARAQYLALVSARNQEDLKSAWKKMVGLADIETAALYVVPTNDERLRRKATLHEVAHIVLPWHNARPKHADDAHTLSAACRDRLDVEANAFANELLFQGNHFRALAGGMRPDIDSVLRLSDLYGASVDDTARLFSCVVRHPLIILTFTDSQIDGRPCLRHESTIVGDHEPVTFVGLAIPEVLAHDHAWYVTDGFQLFVEDHLDGQGYCRRYECGVIRRAGRVFVSMRPIAERMHVLRSLTASASFASR